jgi:hypothetical protein
MVVFGVQRREVELHVAWSDRRTNGIAGHQVEVVSGDSCARAI